MIGAIDHLIAKRYTSAKRVTLSGISFGAIVPGMLMAQRPDLLGAVLYEVGEPDEVRGASTDATAARNIAEIGDVEPVLWVPTAGGHRALFNVSPQWAATAISFMLWQTGDPRYQPVR